MAPSEERLFDTEVEETEYDSMTDKYVTIPPGDSGIPKVGDSIFLTVEAGPAEWKQPGKSLNIPLAVVQEGLNKGKSVEWFAGVTKDGMQVTKKGLRAFGIEDKVLRRIEGKIRIAPLGFAGARAKALFVRELSNKGNLRSVLDSANFQPLDAVPAAK